MRLAIHQTKNFSHSHGVFFFSFFSFSGADAAGAAAAPAPVPVPAASTEPPDPPQDVKSLDINSRKIRLSWTAPYTGNSVIVKYIVQYRTHEGKG